MLNWTAIIAIINLMVVIVGAIAAVAGIRQSVNRAASDIQERVRQALTVENKLLQDRIIHLETDNKRLKRAMKLVVETLKKTHKIDLEIDDDMITLRNHTGKSISQSTQEEETT